MPWSGSGVFNLTYNWPQDAANNIDINANRMQTQEQDLAGNGFGNTITRDGQGVPTANLPMAGFRHTNAQDGQALQDYATVNQVQMGLLEFVAAGGSSDAITAAYSPAVVSLADGLELRFTASAANTTTTPTYSPNSLTAHTITKFGGNALVAGDIQNLQACTVRYNLANTRWELLTPATSFGGPFLLASNNLSDVASDSTSRTNLGVPTGTSGAVLGFLNGTNTWSGIQTLVGTGIEVVIQDDAARLRVDNTAGTVVGMFGTVKAVSGSGSVTNLAILAQAGMAVYSNNNTTTAAFQLDLSQNMILGAGLSVPGTLTFSKQANGPSSALTDASSVLWDVSIAQTATLTIAGNRTLALPTNLVAGGTYLLRVTQGSGGSHTLAYASGYKWAGGTPPVLSTAAGAIDMISFSSDGTNMYGSNILKAFS